MNFLITGGAGFIGGNYCHYAVEKYPQHHFICFDALTYAGNLETLEPIMNKPNFTFVKGDISNAEDVENVFGKFDIHYVINFAAESHVDRSILDPGLFLKTNILGTQVLMDACIRHKTIRFHQVSTDEVYGDLPLDRPDLLFMEKTPLNPSSPYSVSKTSADLLALAYHRTYGLNVTISRCSNNYGPYQFPEKLIPLIIDRALHNKPLPVYGNGLNVRDWLHVYDHCTAIDAIVTKGKTGEIYNIGGHNERANIDVVKTILDVLDKPYSLIEYVKDRPGHDARYAMDPTKIRTELGWDPVYTFEKGIVPTVQWNIDNRKWIENIQSGEYLNFMRRQYGD